MSDYFIKDGYKPNQKNLTLDSKTDSSYWTKSRLDLSSLYQWDVYKIAFQMATEYKAQSVLDIGCGPATKLMKLFNDQFKLYGVDQASTIELCNKLWDRGTFVEDSFEEPSYKLKNHIQSADVIICSDVIEHIEDPDKLLDYIKAFSNEKTVLVLSTPERDALHGKKANSPRNPFHIREWSYSELNKYISNSGFQILEHKTVFPFIFKCNLLTIQFFINALFLGRSLKSTQVVICKILNKT